MTPRRIFHALCAVGAAFLISPSSRADGPSFTEVADDIVVFENGARSNATVYRVWRPICGSDAHDMTVEELRKAVEKVRATLPVVEPDETPARGSVAFNINFSSSNLPAGAQTAIDAVEDYYEALFADTDLSAVINISVTFSSLGGGGPLGFTSSSFTQRSYSNTRSNLIGDGDPDDLLLSFLPVTSLPVRFNGSSSAVTNVSEIFVTLPNIHAAFPSVATGGTHASVTFNSDFPWDYNPANGVPFSAFCFQSTFVHEIGHALGFTSGADDSGQVTLMLDIFRFQRTAFNPANLQEFQTTPRLIDFNNPNDDHNVDFIVAEYRMSDGSPWQSSHFREQSPVIGIMDPAMSNGETFFPNFLRLSDLRAFDAIGYDFADPNGPFGNECNTCIEFFGDTMLGGTSDNSGSTGDDTSCGPGDTVDEWYCYVAPCSGTVVATTCGFGTDFDTTLAVFSSCGGGLLVCNDDIGGNPSPSCQVNGAGENVKSRVTFNATAGVTYYVRVGGAGNATGNYELTISCELNNDRCINAAPITDGPNVFSTVGAASEAGGHVLCGGDGLVHNDVWFTYVASCTGNATFDACSADFNSRLAVYAQPGCSDLNGSLLGCNDDDASCGGSGSTVTVPVVQGETYHVRIGGASSGGTGAGSITITCGTVKKPSCPGDIASDGGGTSDGAVNVFDLLELLGAWGTSGSGADLEEPTDVVNVFDLLDLLGQWGPCPL